MRRCHDRDEIAPRTRLAAGEMHLQDAERRGLGKNPRPCRAAAAWAEWVEWTIDRAIHP